MKTAEEIVNDIVIEEYSFQVPYDGSNNFYNENRIKQVEGMKHYIIKAMHAHTRQYLETVKDRVDYDGELNGISVFIQCLIDELDKQCPTE